MAFTAGQNPNHPKKGANLKVEPVRDPEVIAAIKGNLLAAGQYRNYCLFVLGINTTWRANELLSLTIGHVKDRKAGDILDLKQSKTDAYRMVLLNKTSVSAIALWLEHYPHSRHSGDKAPLFPSSKFSRLNVPALCNLVKKWCTEAGLSGQYGSHTLRKT